VSGSGFSDEYVSTVVRQATAMVSVQLGCDLDEALDRLKIRAMMLNQTVERTALDVLDRVISFDASPPSVTGPDEQDFWP
jgi:hypothetical protein